MTVFISIFGLFVFFALGLVAVAASLIFFKNDPTFMGFSFSILMFVLSMGSFSTSVAFAYALFQEFRSR